MRERNRISDKHKILKLAVNFENYIHVGNKITNEVRRSRKAEVDILSKKLIDKNINTKAWWKTLKRFIKPKQTSSLTLLSQNGTIYSTTKDNANIFNQFIIEQTHLHETNASLSLAIVTPPDILNTIIITRQEVEPFLKSLHICKAYEYVHPVYYHLIELTVARQKSKT